MDDVPTDPGARITWHTTTVAGRQTHYGVGGAGPTVLFLHGWALTNRAYKRPLARLTARQLRVYAPALPGFGGTSDLPLEERTLPGYARWVSDFCAAVDIPTPVTLVGHSFGGGVAIMTAHDFPDLAARLVLVNSIGGSKWTDGRGILRASRDRPIWDWGLHLQADLGPGRQITRVLPVILQEAVPNVIRNPRAVWRVAHLARTADLDSELDELRTRRLPIVIVWSTQDTVIPETTLLSLRAGLGHPKLITVPGGHSWLISNPRQFGEVITNIVTGSLTAPPHESDEAAV
ncbi:alpha/beta hydrolase [Rhodococcus sp. ABRD24]|uniref:alpha/beta fold hydrolase n=1 Tax=Rhodococcus sp. ABRD24 TaxID=2507582 RepID=UPI001040B764|nr:alpha/beta hydrolase [Rhodococcus sp. ABRD24]QBJ96921.1 alpha/beta hydrolase [Rhodococcus sp. ABRD24]